MDEIAGRDADVGQFRKANARATARLLARRLGTERRIGIGKLMSINVGSG
jgi:hypothetical protein